jgi:hypothetical protein
MRENINGTLIISKSLREIELANIPNMNRLIVFFLDTESH